MKRWFAVSIFVVSSTLNYLDRALLATLAPLLMAELHFNQSGYGLLISAFSIAYAAVSLGTGWFLDRAGVNRGISVAVSWWSIAATCTGLVRNLPGLALCRAALGIGESAGVPAVGKLNGVYLKPGERALGAAVNQIGLSAGLALAPLFVGVAQTHGWRLPFVLTGLAGFIWLPLWAATHRSIQPQFDQPPPKERQGQGCAPPDSNGFGLLRDRNLILLVIANVLWMGSYSLWSNWTTLYLVHVHNLTLAQSAHYVWIPPLISNLGGFFGGWLSLAWMHRKCSAIVARRRAIWLSGAGSLATLLLPLMPDAASATAIVSVSFFFALAGSVNIYALPIDLFGAARSGLAIAALTCAFGILQTGISPMIGWLGDHRLYQQVVWLTTLPLIAGALVLSGLREPSVPQ